MRSMADIFRAHANVDETGRHIGGTDKETNHRYGDAYEHIVNNNFSTGPAVPRNVVKLMMEIGVADGSSLLAWREIFPNALCIGLDIHAAARLTNAKPEDRIEFHLGDMRKQADCVRAANGTAHCNTIVGRQFDFICEDATHQLDDTLRCLLYLWPYVRPGGMYVIEEFNNNHSGLWDNIKALWPMADIVNTIGPFNSNEPLVVLRKPL